MATAAQPGPAAFEVRQPSGAPMMLSQDEVVARLDPAALLDALAAGFVSHEQGLVQSPPRPQVVVPDRGTSLVMCAWQAGMQICVKVVNIFDGNLAIGLPNHLATITLFDPDTGATSCVMDGTSITGLRTAAAAALSARLLSRPDARVATIVGGGVQARDHLRFLPLVRDLERINVWTREPEHARRLSELHDLAVPCTDLAAAVRESDIVALATHAADPVIDTGWVRPGTHVTSVGYCPPDGELPRTLLTGNRVFVETVDAAAAPPVGCPELGGFDGAVTTLGAVLLGAAGRIDDGDITVYKAMGLGMEDMVAANLVYQAARRSAGTMAVTG